ncbi:MAG TPA: dihydrofolate reductase family protein [Acidimicrobiia bacterium]|nr:dihydrofolate reductase family protein [Acidimicrobiia bacterium]
MGDIVVFNSVTLDGVMQAPGRPEEDRRGAFAQGGWAAPYQDEVIGKVAAEGMSQGGSVLLGRRTYEDFYSFWPHQTDNPFTDVLNRTQKYVASRSLSDPLPWENSTLLAGEAEETVPRIKKEEGKDIFVLGSGQLIQTLMRHRLIDKFVLLIYPLVLGSGRRMFEEAYARFELVEVVPSTTGVVIATYKQQD